MMVAAGHPRLFTLVPAAVSTSRIRAELPEDGR